MAVGAPYEEGGAVYIYAGSKEGLSVKPVQVLYMKIASKLKLSITLLPECNYLCVWLAVSMPDFVFPLVLLSKYKITNWLLLATFSSFIISNWLLVSLRISVTFACRSSKLQIFQVMTS